MGRVVEKCRSSLQAGKNDKGRRPGEYDTGSHLDMTIVMVIERCGVYNIKLVLFEQLTTLKACNLLFGICNSISST